jgi:hypothetical protein
LRIHRNQCVNDVIYKNCSITSQGIYFSPLQGIHLFNNQRNEH